MEIKAEVSEERVERLIRSIMQNYPEASSLSLVCTSYAYDKCTYTFWDVEEEDDVYHEVDYQKLREGFEILMKMALKADGERGGFYVDGWDPTQFFSDDWDNWESTWDAEVIDGLVQCAIFKDVIYG